MTVSSTINKSGPYFGNGATTTFPYAFKINAASHIRVIRNVTGVDVTVPSNEYTVTGVGNAGGSVVFSTAPASGVTITLLRNVPFTQTTDYENQGAFNAQTMEDALDLAAMRDQQLAEQLNRAVTFPADTDGEELADLIATIYAAGTKADAAASSAVDAATSATNASNSAASAAAAVANAFSKVGGTFNVGADVYTINGSGNAGLIGEKRVDATVALNIVTNEATNEVQFSTYALDGVTLRNQFTMSMTTAGDNKLNGSKIVTTNQTATGLLSAPGGAPMYACRAYVNFIGTGTVTINGSGNVSSITDNGVGDYTVNFTTSMLDVLYTAVFGMVLNNTTSPVVVGEDLAYTRTTSFIRVKVQNFATGNPIDWSIIQLAIFR